MSRINIKIPIIILLVCYLALTQVYRFAHVHSVETDDGYQIEWSLHKVLHPHDHDFGDDDHQEEVEHLIGDWDHIHSMQLDHPPFIAIITVISLSSDQLPKLLYTKPRTGPPPLPPNLLNTSYRGPPLS